MQSQKSCFVLCPRIDIDKINKRRVILNKPDAPNAWIDVDQLPIDMIEYAISHFDQLFNLHPKERGMVGFYSKSCNTLTNIDAHRWYQSYLEGTPSFPQDGKQNYMFGPVVPQCQHPESMHDPIHMHNPHTTHANNIQPLPNDFQPFYDYIQQKKDARYNQVVINWYKDGSDYLPYHIDWTDGMPADATIATISLMDHGYRTFIVKPKSIFADESQYASVRIQTTNGSILTLGGGAVFDKYRHGIPKEMDQTGRRISLTFRIFDKGSIESIE